MKRRLMMVGGILAAVLALLAVLRLRSGSAQAHEMVGRGAILLDVRSPAEFATEHLPGAINIPLGELGARASELGPPATTAIVTYCHSGVRSARAAATLRGLGFAKVLNLGPKAAW